MKRQYIKPQLFTTVLMTELAQLAAVSNKTYLKMDAATTLTDDSEVGAKDFDDDSWE